MNRNKALYLIYDGQCLFCIRSLKLFRAIDVKEVLQFYDAHYTGTIADRFPELAEADFDNAMFAVTEDRQVFRGYYAFNRIVWSSPLTWVLIPFFYFPGSTWPGLRIYAWVARNRRKFGCRSESCVLPSLLEEKSLEDRK